MKKSDRKKTKANTSNTNMPPRNRKEEENNNTNRNKQTGKDQKQKWRTKANDKRMPRDSQETRHENNKATEEQVCSTLSVHGWGPGTNPPGEDAPGATTLYLSCKLPPAARAHTCSFHAWQSSSPPLMELLRGGLKAYENLEQQNDKTKSDVKVMKWLALSPCKGLQ